MTRPDLAPPHPYFGNKTEIADQVWAALGDVVNFVDPFCGSCSVLYARPDSAHEPPIETVNDAWGLIPNFLRALRAAPEEVARHADWPVSELDLNARHRWLLRMLTAKFVRRLRTDESFFDAKVAGYFVWGQSLWIGSGFCVPGAEGHGNKLPHLTGGGPNDNSPHYGKGIFRKELPDEVLRALGPNPSRLDILIAYFRLFARRLERVRIVCGDFRRVLTPAVTFAHGLTGIFLDPPYGKGVRGKAKFYAADSLDVAADARMWAGSNGANPLLRIVLAGYAGEHEALAELGWTSIPWKGRGGYANQGAEAKTVKERLWLSPHCLGGRKYLGPLFEERRKEAPLA